ncbi:hypothetical protein HRbin12_00835 [bacterium HR12]|nr:hypothetical protein HRbin12_00835 [bacterium HR12]
MSRVFPFVGLLFDRERVGSLDLVTTPPYDVISPADRRRFQALSPYNVIRLELGERAPGGDPDDQYRGAADTLRRWRETGVLRPTDGPAYFAYEMRFRLHGRDRRVRGVVAAVELEDWGGSILPHERTMPGPIEDRLRLLRATGANLSCIQAVFTGPISDLARMLDALTVAAPDACAVDEAGVEHRLWVVPPERLELGRLLEPERLMIADGHHRYTTALRYRDEMRERHGPGPWDRVMMLLVDATLEDPPVLPYHRLLLEGDPDVGTGTRVPDLHELIDGVDDERSIFGLVTLDRGILAHHLVRLEGTEPPTVLAIHRGPLAGKDPHLRFTPDAAAAEDAVRRGRARAAFILPPTSARRIREVVERGERLPQKSTFFWPKPRSGMVIRALDADRG